MRVVVMADCHIDHNVGGLNAEQAWRSAWEFVADTKPEIAIVAGDLFHNGSPAAAALNYAGDGFQMAKQAGVPVLLIAGNHEWIRVDRSAGKPLPIEVFSRYANVKVVKVPELIQTREGLKVAAIPWPSPTCDLESTLEAINGFAEKLASHQGARLLAGHAMIVGGERGNEIKLVPHGADEPTIPLDVIDRPHIFGHSIFGHIHKRQNLSPSCSYVGSTDRITFADEGEARGISELEWQPKTQRWTERLVDVAQHDFRTLVAGVDEPSSIVQDLSAVQVRLRAPVGISDKAVERLRQAVERTGGRVLYVKHDADPDADTESDDHADTSTLSLEEALREWCRLEGLEEQKAKQVISTGLKRISQM